MIFSLVHDAATARRAVAACTYRRAGAGHAGQGPPARGAVGLCDEAGYLADPDKYLLKIMQIESCQGWRNLDEILAVPGMDGVYLGPADLGRSLAAQPAPVCLY